jgi:hypothetical protein
MSPPPFYARAEAERLQGPLAKTPFLITDNARALSLSAFRGMSRRNSPMCAFNIARRCSSGYWSVFIRRSSIRRWIGSSIRAQPRRRPSRGCSDPNPCQTPHERPECTKTNCAASTKHTARLLALASAKRGSSRSFLIEQPYIRYTGLAVAVGRARLIFA